MFPSQRKKTDGLELLSLTVACSDTCHLQDCFVWILIPPSGAFDLQLFKSFFLVMKIYITVLQMKFPGYQRLFMRGFRFRSSPFSCLRPGRPERSQPSALNRLTREKTSRTKGRVDLHFAIKTIKDCTSIAIKVCYLCWHCREQWIRSCCDQWFRCEI